jgi:phosphoribosyl 1,2-cyclic phosphodiesterase
VVSHLNNTLSTCVLGTSSGGNATLVWNSETAILVDCGFSPAYIACQLRNHGLSIRDLDGVFITHIHGDHVNHWTVENLIHEHVPIFSPHQMEPYLKRKYTSLARASRENLLKPMIHAEIELGSFLVRSFSVPHDSDGGCFGYQLFSHADGTTKKVSVSTDMAHPTTSAMKSMANSNVIVIESNYDLEMLEGSARPTWLKRRIEKDGHLSNDQCAEALLQIIDYSETVPKAIALAHISQECNTNDLALNCTKTALGSRKIAGISVLETHPDRSSTTITV